LVLPLLSRSLFIGPFLLSLFCSLAPKLRMLTMTILEQRGLLPARNVVNVSFRFFV